LALNTGIGGWSGSPVGRVEYGETNVFTSTGTLHFDDIGVSDGTWLGAAGKQLQVFVLDSDAFLAGDYVTASFSLDKIYDSPTEIYFTSSQSLVMVPDVVTVPAGVQTGSFQVRGRSNGGSILASLLGYTSPDQSIEQEVTVNTFIPPAMLPSSIYRVVLEDLSSNPIDELPIAGTEALAYSEILNAAGAATFVLPLTHPSATEENLKEGARQVAIYRDTVREWGGYLWTVNATNQGVNITCGGYLSRLGLRLINTDRTYTTTDQFNIAWDLIAYTQAKEYGNLGILQYPVNPSGVLRTLSYVGTQETTVLQALSDLAALDNGFDFEITPDKLWIPYYQRKGQNNGIVFSLDKNILDISWARDAQNMANDVTAIGSSTGSAPLISHQADTVFQQTYGLLEASTSWTDVTTQAALDAHALTDLATMKISRDDPQISVTVDDPPLDAFSTGDIVLIDAHRGFIDIHGYYRVITKVVEVNKEGRDVVTLTFDTQVS
jgi:hypothetical protein